MRTNVVLVIAAMLVLTGSVQALGGGNGGFGEEAVPGLETQDEPPDPETDVLGWENGYWYNETINVDVSDGLNETERRRIISRAMARIERIRRLEFEGRVPVEVVPRGAFREQQGGETVPAALQTFDNVKYEALFMVNESTDSIAVQRRNSGTAVGGFYSPTDDRIVVVSENVTSPKLDEITLAHELVHALQDQHFDLSEFNQSTREQHNSIDGLVEGDASYVEYLYERRCEGEWSGTCLEPTERAAAGSGALANVGPYLIKFQPYSDGAPFLESIRNAEGWEGVNALYEDPPASTEQIIHPKLYGTDQPRPVTVEDTSNDAWNRLEPDERVDYGELGEAGMFSMLVYPGLETQGDAQIVPVESFLTPTPGMNETALDPYNYSHPYTAGWDGDELVAYVNDETPPNETGYVWKSVWDSPEDAEEFLTGYRELLRLHGAERVEDRENTWVIPDDSGFSDAFYVTHRNDTVTVVNAPTVEQLSGVHTAPAPGGAGNETASAIRSP